jgi:hypothetical protein
MTASNRLRLRDIAQGSEWHILLALPFLQPDAGGFTASWFYGNLAPA